MSTLPLAFEKRIRCLLGEEYVRFTDSIKRPSPVSIRINPAKCGDVQKLAGKLLPESPALRPVPWCANGFYLEKRPVFTLDPHIHGGAYYVQEASSMFIDYIIRKLSLTGNIKALDICAAPGGKSTLMSSLLPPSALLVSNEVIRSRAAVLKENTIKWGSPHTVVTSSDPSDFSRLGPCFDLILADAPCSGEGLFRKDPGAVSEWKEGNLKICSERQKRILSDAWKALKSGGYMIYSTCTYNPEENERNIEWLAETSDAEVVEIPHKFEGIKPGSGNLPSYRFYPHRIEGEGFFIAIIRKLSNERQEDKTVKYKKSGYAPEAVPKSVTVAIAPHIIRPEEFSFYMENNTAGVIPEAHCEFIRILENRTNLIYKGCELAEIAGKDLKWQPAFALSNILKRESFRIRETDKTEALNYLKRHPIDTEAPKGCWEIVSYDGLPIGWSKSLGSRSNNYHPKEWRILMEI